MSSISKTNVAILYGGKSGEHEVSKISAASVIRNFDRQRYALTLVGIDTDGIWHLQPQEVLHKTLDGENLELRKDAAVWAVPGKGLRTAEGGIDSDCVFPVLHGTNGEDGTVQGFIETLDIPYAGTGLLASALGMDKIKAKELWRSEGLPVVPFASLEKRTYNNLNDAKRELLYRQWTEELGDELFIKPCRSGSSVGISKVGNSPEILAAVELAFEFDESILVEPSIDIREIECSVLGSFNPESFPPGEVISHHEFYDYSGKYLDPQGASFKIPAELDTPVLEKIRGMAVHAFEIIRGEGLARVDFFLERGTGTLYLNEINTMPGFTAISMYPKMCEAGGLGFPDLLGTLVELGLDRHRRKSSLNLRFDQ